MTQFGIEGFFGFVKYCMKMKPKCMCTEDEKPTTNFTGKLLYQNGWLQRCVHWSDGCPNSPPGLRRGASTGFSCGGKARRGAVDLSDSAGGVSVCGRMCAFVWKQDCLHLCMARDSGQVRLNDDLCGHVQQV
jgi:hypothetical protein